MDTKQLFDLAPLGALIAFSNGKPRPPDRHRKKLLAWKGLNSTGRFISVDPGDPEKTWAVPHFSIMELDDPVLTVIRIHLVGDNELSYEVKPPTPGMILAYHSYNGGKIEIRHVWQDLNTARTWAYGYGRGGKADYCFANCGLKYFLVQEDGKLVDYMPADRKAA